MKYWTRSFLARQVERGKVGELWPKASQPENTANNAFITIPYKVNLATCIRRCGSAVSQMKKPISPPQANEIHAISEIDIVINVQISAPLSSQSTHGIVYPGPHGRAPLAKHG